MREEDRKKRNIAIAAAVMNYIKSESEMAVTADLVAANKGNSPLERGPFTRENAWGASARQAQMQNRTTMQIKALHK